MHAMSGSAATLESAASLEHYIGAYVLASLKNNSSLNWHISMNLILINFSHQHNYQHEKQETNHIQFDIYI